MVLGKKLLTDWKLVISLEKSIIYYVGAFRWGPRSIIPTLGNHGRKQAFHSLYCKWEGYEHCFAVFFVLSWTDKWLQVSGDGYIGSTVAWQHFLTSSKVWCIFKAQAVDCYSNQHPCCHLTCLSYISLATAICNTWCHLWKSGDLKKTHFILLILPNSKNSNWSRFSFLFSVMVP